MQATKMSRYECNHIFFLTRVLDSTFGTVELQFLLWMRESAGVRSLAYRCVAGREASQLIGTSAFFKCQPGKAGRRPRTASQPSLNPPSSDGAFRNTHAQAHDACDGSCNVAPSHELARKVASTALCDGTAATPEPPTPAGQDTGAHGSRASEPSGAQTGMPRTRQKAPGAPGQSAADASQRQPRDADTAAKQDGECRRHQCISQSSS
jgi:hypothetical protein